MLLSLHVPGPRGPGAGRGIRPPRRHLLRARGVRSPRRPDRSSRATTEPEEEIVKTRKPVIQTFQPKEFLKLGRYEVAATVGAITNDPFLNRHPAAGQRAPTTSPRYSRSRRSRGSRPVPTTRCAEPRGCELRRLQADHPADHHAEPGYTRHLAHLSGMRTRTCSSRPSTARWRSVTAS